MKWLFDWFRAHIFNQTHNSTFFSKHFTTLTKSYNYFKHHKILKSRHIFNFSKSIWSSCKMPYIPGNIDCNLCAWSDGSFREGWLLCTHKPHVGSPMTWIDIIRVYWSKWNTCIWDVCTLTVLISLQGQSINCRVWHLDLGKRRDNTDHEENIRRGNHPVWIGGHGKLPQPLEISGSVYGWTWQRCAQW